MFSNRSSHHRWYPNAEITGLDRDSAFIQFAGEHEPGISFVEGDAAKLPYPDNTFDVTISFTVSEHIDPSAFFQEQLRVLKPGGVCLVLSSRKGITFLHPSFPIATANRNSGIKPGNTIIQRISMKSAVIR